MLGRTHMSLGALGAIVTTPILLHTGWVPISQGLVHHSVSPLIRQGLFVVPAILGSAVVDLDQKDSLLARRVERIGQLAILVVLIGIVVLLHATTSLGAWIVVGILGLSLLSQANFARKIALGVLAAGVLVLGSMGYISMLSGFLFATWSLGAMLTPHRTFTHSIPGALIFSAGMVFSISHSNGMDYVLQGAVLGYVLHILADVPSGGVPLLWPIIRSRQGVELVQTGGLFDHLIGGAALILFFIWSII